MLNKLYQNIGRKIKIWAIWMFIVEAIGSIVSCFSLLYELGIEDGWWALLLIPFGPIVAYVSTWILYAFGELVEDTHAVRSKYCPETEKTEHNENEKRVREQAKKDTRPQQDANTPHSSLQQCDFCGKKSSKLGKYHSTSSLDLSEMEYTLCDRCAKKNGFM